MGRTSPPVLLFDGDCAFCSSTARWLERRVPTPARLVAWQHAELEPLGVTVEEVDAAVVMVGVDLHHRSGPEGFADWLRTSTSGFWRAAGRVLDLFGIETGPLQRWGEDLGLRSSDNAPK